jgi:hypothetical protein
MIQAAMASELVKRDPAYDPVIPPLTFDPHGRMRHAREYRRLIPDGPLSAKLRSTTWMLCVWFLICAVGLFVFGGTFGVSRATPSAIALTRDFEVVLMGAPTEPPYRGLMDHLGRGLHLVCPFDYRKDRSIRVFLRADEPPAPGSSLVGLKVLTSEPVSDARRHLAACSDLLSGIDQKRSRAAVDSYLWAPRQRTNQLPDADMELEARAHNAIALSGLPITSDLTSNVGHCFEMAKGSDQPPSYWLSLVGVSPPPSTVERKMPGVSCEEAIRTLY